jgi:hypothetical protein
MIRVTVDLISAIDQSRSKTLGVCEIVNDGTGTIHSCDYDVRLSKWAPKLSETWKKGRVIGFPRTVRGPWDLPRLLLVHPPQGRRSPDNEAVPVVARYQAR